MAHLSEKHDAARRRHHLIIQDRSLSLARKTICPLSYRSENFEVKDPIKIIKTAEKLENIQSAVPSTAPDTFVHIYKQCNDRVKVKLLNDTELKLKLKHEIEEKNKRNLKYAEIGPTLAKKRLHDAAVRNRKVEEEKLCELMYNQPTALDAMNVARLLSPRLENTISKMRPAQISSDEDLRVRELMESDRIGSYYK